MAANNAVKTKMIPVNDIIVPDGRRVVDVEQVTKLAASIQELGLMNPIWVTPENQLISGNHRLKAVEQLESPAKNSLLQSFLQGQKTV